MIDIARIRDNPELVRSALLKRMESVDFSQLLGWDKDRRSLITEAEALKARRNEASALIPRLKKEGKDASAMLAEMKQVSASIKEIDDRRGALESQIQSFLDQLPNIPDDDLAAGGKENNAALRSWGQRPSFSFTPQHHVDLVTSLGLIDYERGVKMGGNGFWLYRGRGALLEWALLSYFIESHLADGYEFMLPPHLLVEQCGYVAGQFPKFTGDVFHLDDGSHFLLPTAETALINVYRDEILPEETLPRKLFAYSPCYRREAGSYRARERGMIRGHQFNKIEMFQFTVPEDSDRAFEELVGKAERLVQGLGLHHRITKLAAGDCSAAMARTYDLEVWMPSMEDFTEVSSISNSRDYQARRGNIRYKQKGSGKNQFIHSLNASGLATSRILPAMVEQFQRQDGTVEVPAVLRKWVGTSVLEPGRLP
jgi:seryl-tRNA synthetase